VDASGMVDLALRQIAFVSGGFIFAALISTVKDDKLPATIFLLPLFSSKNAIIKLVTSSQ
jgi:hypothetical protein